VVIPNGGFGSIFDGSLRPFVTSVIPVVGNPGDIVEPYTAPYQAPPSLGSQWSDIFASEPAPRRSSTSESTPVQYGSRTSTAAQGDLSVAEITSLRAAQDDALQQEIDALVAEADAYLDAGQYSRARSSLRKAIKRSDGRQRYDLQLRLESLLDK
jgi:hypothetical protein